MIILIRHVRSPIPLPFPSFASSHSLPEDKQSDLTDLSLSPKTQKFTAFSPRLDLLAVGTTDIDGTQSTVTLLTYPGMEFVWRWESTDSKIDGELVDIDFGADGSSVSEIERAD